jgi:ATP-dependent Clp protease adaptor protein ClpS
MADSKPNLLPGVAEAPAADRKAATAARKPDPKPLPPYNVVLLDDNDHTYEYVIRMLVDLFSHTPEKAFEMARAVDKQGRVIVLTTHKELAELKREQIVSYGPDVLMASSKSSMGAVIEPAT